MLHVVCLLSLAHDAVKSQTSVVYHDNSMGGEISTVYMNITITCNV